MANAFRNLIRMSQQGGGSPVVGALAKVVAGGATVAFAAYQSLWTVEGGHRGVIFSRLGGVQPRVYEEGTHFRIPWLEQPQIFDIRTRPKTSRSLTGTRDLQMVDVSLRVLYKPRVESLPQIWSELGTDFDARVLPSIVNETLKSVVAQFNASQLITQRDQVSRRVREFLVERARDFHILVDDVSITHLSFSPEYSAAVEAKQVAQQEAERAKFIVERAVQDKKSTVIRAEAEARAAELVGVALQQDPAWVELRRLETARQIAKTVAGSQNRMYLNSDALLLNVLDSASYDRMVRETPKK